MLENVAIILKSPKYAGNIGAAARSCYNMGIKKLILVSETSPESEPMARMATHNAAHIIENMEIFTSLPEAIAPFSYIVGTTARTGRKRTSEQTPRDIMQDLLPLLPNNKIAFLFGPEDRGLTNNDLKYCQYTSSIPTADFSSLNLAQAVAIHCYELYYSIVESTREPAALPVYASSFQLEGMYEHVENALLKIDFLNEKSHHYWMKNIRQFLGRIRLTEKDANIIRGICRQFLWYQGSRIASREEPESNE
ncbi:MAG: RNA methyltransferase [Desulfobulbaceae bacterium]|nr:MAG: RNA methyltransferase [Desulfobulbaceae bacterium]